MKFQTYASGSKGNFHVVSEGRVKIGLECGLTIHEMGVLSNFRISRLAGILVSHYHQDHCRGARDVMRWGIPLFASEEAAVRLARPGQTPHIVTPGHSITLTTGESGEWLVLPWSAVHDASGTLGFLIESPSGDRLLYATDTGYVSHRFAGLTHIAVEANYSSAILRESGVDVVQRMRLLRHHMSIERVIELLRVNDLSKVWEIHLLHLSDRHSDEEMFQRMVREATGKPVYVGRAK